MSVELRKLQAGDYVLTRDGSFHEVKEAYKEDGFVGYFVTFTGFEFGNYYNCKGQYLSDGTKSQHDIVKILKVVK